MKFLLFESWATPCSRSNMLISVFRPALGVPFLILSSSPSFYSCELLGKALKTARLSMTNFALGPFFFNTLIAIASRS